MKRLNSYWLPVFLGLFIGLMPMPSHADDTAPLLSTAVLQEANTKLSPVGSGAYRKLGFSIYHATLFAPNSVYHANKPYALQLRYDRSLSQDTLIDAVMDDIAEQKVADAEALAKWKKLLETALPAVEEGDVITGLALPGKKAMLFFNGKLTTTITDESFSMAFFNIWLGAHADEDLRNKLLANVR